MLLTAAAFKFESPKIYVGCLTAASSSDLTVVCQCSSNFESDLLLNETLLTNDLILSSIEKFALRAVPHGMKIFESKFVKSWC